MHQVACVEELGAREHGVGAWRFREQLSSGLDALHRRVLAETSPDLARAVHGARLVGKLWPFPGREGFLRRSFGPGWALVGDAGFFRDPITAHGITDALRDAELLARAVLRGTDRDLAGYQSARDAMARGMLDVSDEIASFAWDLEQAKILHLGLSRQMNAEVEVLRELGPAPGARASSSAIPAACPVTWPVQRIAG